MAATKIKVIELAKELGVTSKDLMVAAEEMGHKGVRAMTPLDQKLANELRVKLGKGRELPEEPAKAKRAAKPKAPVVLGPDGQPLPKKPRTKKAKAEEAAEDAGEVRPAATIVKPRPAAPLETPPEPIVVKPAAEITPEPPKVAPVTTPPVEPVRPAAAAPPAPPAPARPEPKIVPFRPLERPTPPSPQRP
ncbi:MAG TPA: translation initiation factor IF-2 N-terminal domain-containing protein, partial [Methylomirabilota bacterium]|nr:translation initiation factor IF-2 N-terminal domain-containing protein [Methylomirabilota bacterium]